MKVGLKYKLWNNSRKIFEDECELLNSKGEKEIGWIEDYYLDIKTGEILIEEYSGDGVIAYASDMNFVAPKDEIIPLRYIGRLDREGSELYEGCIVHLNLDFMRGYYDVVWNEKNAGFEFVIRGMLYETEFISNMKSEDIKIVGNIYENENDFKNDER